MAPVLQRVTTVYSVDEDRIRLAGATSDGQQVVIWLSRRLLGFLIPILLRQLDRQFAASTPEHRDMLQEFAQQAARDGLGAAAAVVARQDDESMLASAVDVGTVDSGAVLTFRDPSGRAYAFPLTTDALRQWLHILHKADRKAAWNLPQWPQWMLDDIALKANSVSH